METRTFHGLPLRCGDITVARLSGEVELALKPNGEIKRIKTITLKGEHDESVEILNDDPLWEVVEQALTVMTKSLSRAAEKTQETDSTETSPAPDLDNARPEGAAS